MQLCIKSSIFDLINNENDKTVAWFEKRQEANLWLSFSWPYLIRPSGVTGGGQSGPLTFFTGKFLLTYGKKRGKEERENEEEEKDKERLKTENGRVKSTKESRGLFFFFFPCSFSSFCLSLLNHWNLFGVYQNGQFLPEKGIFHAVKKSGKVTLPPLKNIPLMLLSD